MDCGNGIDGGKLFPVAAALRSLQAVMTLLCDLLQWWKVSSSGDGGEGAPSGDNVNSITRCNSSKFLPVATMASSSHGNSV